MSTTTELGAYLESKGIGALKTTLFLGPAPMGAPNAVSVTVLTAGRTVRAMGPALTYPIADAPSFQAVVRNTDYTAGEAKVRSLIDVLDHYWGTLGGTEYLYVSLEYGPVYLGLDENNRHRWSMTFNAVKRRS